MRAPNVVLAAGTFGSTYLLLRNKENFPDISPMLGRRFSGNGDLLGLADGCTETFNGKRRPRVLDPVYGPVITTTVKIPDKLEGTGGGGPGYYIQDGGWPYIASWGYELMRPVSLFRRAVRFALRYWFGALGLTGGTNLSRSISHLIGDSDASSSLLVLLGMGRDTPGGRMWLSRDRLEVAWSKRQSKAYFRRLTWTMEDIARHHGATLNESPIGRYFGRLITAHPLGGCPVANSKEFGVVDSCGEVFSYPGLFVADGSVMPGPVGANPSLTIAALAHRFMRVALKEGRIASSRRPQPNTRMPCA